MLRTGVLTSSSPFQEQPEGYKKLNKYIEEGEQRLQVVKEEVSFVFWCLADRLVNVGVV